MYREKTASKKRGRFGLYFLLILAGVITANLGMESVAHAESEGNCRQYAEAAVNAFRENEAIGCRFSNARWQPNYNNHFNWCLSALPQWVKNEEEFRANQLRVCRRDAQAVECNKYAISASGDQRSNLSGSCGFTGPRWQDNYDEHLRWCLHVPFEAANREINIRFAMLGVCGREPNFVRCDGYARQASAQVAEALARGCNFTGPRWTPLYEDHLAWCIGQPAEDANSEARKREGPLSQCRTTNPLPEGTQIPGEQCSVSVVIRNRSCLNADGTPSSRIPGSSTVSGCGGNVENARARAKLNFTSTFGCLSEGDTPAPSCCTVSEETVAGCLCR